MEVSSSRYETKDRALKELEKRTRRLFESRLDWEPPYDDTDLDEVWSGEVPRRKRVSRRPGHRVKLTGRLMDLSETHSYQGYSEIEVLRKVAKETRDLLGIADPVPLGKLKRTMEKLGHAEYVRRGVASTRFDCPWDDMQLEWPGKFLVSLGTNTRFYLNTEGDRDKAHLLASAIRLVSRRLACHPAFALAFLISETPVESYAVNAVVDPLGGVSINSNYRVPASAVLEAYSIAKQVYAAAYLGGSKNPKGHSRKLRYPSPRVKRLVAFVDQNERTSWKNLLKGWNERNPDSRYSSLNSMRTVYYRATTGTGKNDHQRESMPKTKREGRSHEES